MCGWGEGISSLYSYIGRDRQRQRSWRSKRSRYVATRLQTLGRLIAPGLYLIRLRLSVTGTRVWGTLRACVAHMERVFREGCAFAERLYGGLTLNGMASRINDLVRWRPFRTLAGSSNRPRNRQPPGLGAPIGGRRPTVRDRWLGAPRRHELREIRDPCRACSSRRATTGAREAVGDPGSPHPRAQVARMVAPTARRAARDFRGTLAPYSNGPRIPSSCGSATLPLPRNG